MYIFIITIIIIIYLSQRYRTSEEFINNYDVNKTLLNILKDHSDIIEGSIKYNLVDGTINHKRYTIPIQKYQLNDYLLDRLINEVGYPKEIKDIIKDENKNNDIIFGIDEQSNSLKLYIDKAENNKLDCFEYNNSTLKKQKLYKVISNSEAKLYAKKLNLEYYLPIGNWDISLLQTVTDNSSQKKDSVHVSLKTPVKFIGIPKFSNDYVYWIAISKDHITFYTRRKSYNILERLYINYVKN